VKQNPTTEVKDNQLEPVPSGKEIKNWRWLGNTIQTVADKPRQEHNEPENWYLITDTIAAR